MLNESLFDLIVIEATKYKTKVLFMGDEAQLPPVNESISKIFTSVGGRYQLTKVERQSDSNPIMSVYDLIRSDLKARSDLFIHRTATNEKTGEGIVFHNSLKDFENAILPLYASDEFRADSDFIKLITYTNDSVKAWNKRIRDHIHNSPSLPIIEGDILLGYNTIMADREELLLENSSDYKVTSVREGRSSKGIDVYECTISSVDENTQTEISIVRESGIPAFLKEFNHLIKQAKEAPQGRQRGFMWKLYFGFKQEHLLLSDITGPSGLLVKKDIDYGYAITCHKSQGSTFVNVAVSETNLDRNRNDEERNKLKYVAFSRPTHQAIIYTNKR
jgi:ATP-dependent exoDNAse (exonuclease V) alpha subunit